MKPSALITLLIVPLILGSAQTPPTSITYAPKPGPGQGRHIVFLSGDEEYRGEEGLPMLAKILSQRHGFKTSVLFSVDPDGTIDPKATTSLSDPATLDTADAVVMLLRFRTWPDETMERFDRLLRAGKPIVAIRTSTHAFNGFPKGSRWESWNYNNNGGFGKRVLGETWLTHWGRHKVEATRGIVEPAQKNHPLLRGVPEIFGDRQTGTGGQRSADARGVDAHLQERRGNDQPDTGNDDGIGDRSGERRAAPPDREWRVLGPRDGSSCGS